MKKAIKPALKLAGGIAITYMLILRSIMSIFGEPDSWKLFFLVSPIVLFLVMFFILLYQVKASPLIDVLRAIGQSGEQCDPNILLQAADKALSEVKDDKFNNQLYVYKSMALIDLGRFEEARALLTGVRFSEVSDEDANIKLTKYMFYDSLVELEIYSGRLDAAYQNYQMMLQEAQSIESEVFSDGKMNKEKEKQIAALRATSLFAQARIFLHSGNPQHIYQAERLLSDPFTGLTTPDDKVRLALARGKLHLKQGRMPQARQELQFVMDNGNAMRARGEAQSLLMSLPALN